jgi:hypothetical protein
MAKIHPSLIPRAPIRPLADQSANGLNAFLVFEGDKVSSHGE